MQTSSIIGFMYAGDGYRSARYALTITSACMLFGCASPAARTVDLPAPEFPCSFTAPPYIHPRIIQDLSAWMSDGGDQVVAIDLPDSQDSNRYYGAVRERKTAGGPPFVYVEGDNEEFGYQYVGRSDHGVDILFTSDWEGGSGIFRNLLLVTFERDRGAILLPGSARIDAGRERLLIKKLGEIPLGDRYSGRLEVLGDRLLIGKDSGWFSVSGGAGGSGRTRDEILLLDLAR